MKTHSRYFYRLLLLSSVLLFITSAALQAANEDLDNGVKNTQPLNHSTPQVNIKVKFVEMPEAVATKLLIGFAAGQPTTLGTTIILTDPQARVTLRSLVTNKEVNILNMPEVITLSGRQAHVQMVDMMTVMTGIKPEALSPPGVSATNDDVSAAMVFTNMLLGPMVDLLPHVSADGHTIQLSVTPSLSEFEGYDDPGPSSMNLKNVYVNGKKLPARLPLPHFRIRKITTSALIWDGQTLVLDGPASQKTIATKEDSRSESSSNKKRRLMVFITPTIIDAAGNRVHTNEDMPFTQQGIPVQPK